MHHSARILDANLNRAREALRVMEDIARFALSDGDLAADLKVARHSLHPIAAAGLDPGTLASWRDTPNDPGIHTTTVSEQARANLRAVAIAAGKRAGEALRVIEECLKIDPDSHEPASSAKALRYRIYDLEQRLTLALGSGLARQRRLCVLITESLCAGRDWQAIASGALRGGADMLQLREKNLPDRELLDRAKRLVALCHEHRATAVINDRPDIALLARADGVHIGQDDLSIPDVRRIAGFALLVGASTTDMHQAHAAARNGADYCGLGPMFPTATKHKPALAGPGYLRQYLADPHTARIPHLAIGGITAPNAATLAQAGCLGIAVSSAVCAAPDPEQACQDLLHSLNQQP